MRKLLLPLVLLFVSMTCFGYTVTPEDFKEICQAAEQGNAKYQLLLGGLYCCGRGVAKDDAEAVKWFRKAAEQGYAMAQSNLGVMYVNGEGVPQDNVVACMWWNIAAAKGNEEAKSNKGITSAEMTEEQIAEAQKLSREWLANR